MMNNSFTENEEQQSLKEEGTPEPKEKRIHRCVIRRIQSSDLDVLPQRHSMLKSIRNFDIDDIDTSHTSDTSDTSVNNERDEEEFSFKRGRRYSGTFPVYNNGKIIDIEQGSDPKSGLYPIKLMDSVALVKNGHGHDFEESGKLTDAKTKKMFAAGIILIGIALIIGTGFWSLFKIMDNPVREPPITYAPITIFPVSSSPLYVDFWK